MCVFDLHFNAHVNRWGQPAQLMWVADSSWEPKERVTGLWCHVHNLQWKSTWLWFIFNHINIFHSPLDSDCAKMFNQMGFTLASWYGCLPQQGVNFISNEVDSAETTDYWTKQECWKPLLTDKTSVQRWHMLYANICTHYSIIIFNFTTLTYSMKYVQWAFLLSLIKYLLCLSVIGRLFGVWQKVK